MDIASGTKAVETVEVIELSSDGESDVEPVRFPVKRKRPAPVKAKTDPVQKLSLYEDDDESDDDTPPL